eukprot:jgi/Ulvmu1/9252/UM050_0001.1
MVTPTDLHCARPDKPTGTALQIMALYQSHDLHLKDANLVYMRSPTDSRTLFVTLWKRKQHIGNCFQCFRCQTVWPRLRVMVMLPQSHICSQDLEVCRRMCVCVLTMYP